ncbi:hypothetical protein DFH27DRAFT_584211 [Peziza echinospora]|nr:hypothetical protein DFH27DRAFT_584211 [Peziza echinospora]
MSKLTSLLLFATILASPALSSPIPQTSTPPSTVSLLGLNYSGTGCVVGGGSVSASWASASSPIIITHQRMNPKAGPGVSFAENRKFCQLYVDIGYPTGYQYAVVDVKWSGFVHLEGTATGTVTAVNQFSGFPGTPISFTSALAGPLNQNFNVDVPAAEPLVIWSPCQTGIPVDVTNEIKIGGASAGPGASYFGGSTIGADYASQLKVELRWRQC